MVIDINIHVHVTNCQCIPAVESGREIWAKSGREIFAEHVRDICVKNALKKRRFFRCVYKHFRAQKKHAHSTQLSRKSPASFYADFPAPYCDFHGPFVHLTIRKQRNRQDVEKKTAWPTEDCTHGVTNTGTRTDYLKTLWAAPSLLHNQLLYWSILIYCHAVFNNMGHIWNHPSFGITIRSSKLIILWYPEIVGNHHLIKTNKCKCVILWDRHPHGSVEHVVFVIAACNRKNQTKRSKKNRITITMTKW